MRQGYRIFVRGLILGLFALLMGCQQEPVGDRQLIEQQLRDMARAVEKRNIGQFSAVLHQDFLGQGRLRKANIAGLLLLHFKQHQSISTHLLELDIVPEGNKAEVTMRVQVNGQGGGWLGQGRVVQIQSRWLQSDGEWQVERARWKVSR